MSGQELVTTGATDVDVSRREDVREFVTFHIAGQLFGIPVLIVQDILLPERIASIPLAPPEVRGSINLRGRIVTVIDVVKQIEGDATDDDVVAAVVDEKPKVRSHMMGVTVEQHNELYTLLVDSVGDVISLSKKNYEGNPSTLDPLWREFASGVYRLDNHLMVVLDVERLLDIKKR
jgi:purine-binding chemotaxis protein CheW